ncbi:hypothetical protein F5Y10DRAFT_283765 [Nemania abortiva]|nr:hypothetical protein F5Y10DRAFT_283765 [Nemania abortiva]
MKETSATSKTLHHFVNPGEILSILLLLGPDIVQTAVAQLAGRAITPVVFSFGWVGYAVSALFAAFRDGRLMPDADVDGIVVVDVDTGHRRTTKSWVLGRLFRDEDNRLINSLKNEAAHVPPETGSEPPKQDWEALRVTIYEVDNKPPRSHGVPTLDWAWYSGLAVIIIQLLIAMRVSILSNTWATFVITASGNALALIGGSLPQWRREKWGCPKDGGPTVVLTQGDGSRHAIVVIGAKKERIGLDLRVLAWGMRTTRASWVTKVTYAVLALLWVILLIAVSSLKEDTWYLLGIGLLGSIQNLFVASTVRSPSALGIHVKFVRVIRDNRVAKVLKEAEIFHHGLGASLLDIFFPGGMRVKGEDLDFWRAALESRYAPNKYGTPVNHIPPMNPSSNTTDKEIE